MWWEGWWCLLIHHNKHNELRDGHGAFDFNRMHHDHDTYTFKNAKPLSPLKILIKIMTYHCTRGLRRRFSNLVEQIPPYRIAEWPRECWRSGLCTRFSTAAFESRCYGGSSVYTKQTTATETVVLLNIIKKRFQKFSYYKRNFCDDQKITEHYIRNLPTFSGLGKLMKNLIFHQLHQFW